MQKCETDISIVETVTNRYSLQISLYEMRKNFLRFLVVGETETRGKMKKPPCLPSYDDVQVSFLSKGYLES